MEHHRSGQWVLIVDDEGSVRETLRSTIQSAIGCEVETAASGPDALDILNRRTFDVIVTDMVMPGLSGLELVTALRKQCPDAHIMVFTGHPQEFPYVDVVRAGADDFVVKPLFSGEMSAKLVRIFKERELRERLTLEEKKYRSLFEFSMDPMLLLSRDGYVITDANSAFYEMSGRKPGDVLGKTLPDLLDAREAERLRKGFTTCALGGRGTLGDVALSRPDGEDRSVDVSVTFIDVIGNGVLFLLLKDVTEKREIEHRITTMAQTDPLSGLFNRRTFSGRLEFAVAQAQRERAPLSLIFLDIDNFKKCNDTHGHQAGDEVIKTVAQIMRGNIRGSGDGGFRYGGDEFAVILSGSTEAGGKAVAARMQSQFGATENFGSTLSMGIAQYVEGMSASGLVRSADAALYHAKSLGRNCISVFSPALT